MRLNIKDPEAYKLARALARETGETMTTAVTEALRLEQVRRRNKPEATAAELLAIGLRCARALKGTPVHQGMLLYDERGVPR